MKRGQTPFTPAVGILYEASDMVNYIEEIGLDQWLKNIENNALYFRKKIVEAGFELPNYHQSNAVTMFFTKGDTAHELKEYLASKGLFINPSSGKYANNAVRVANIGDLHQEDYDILIEEIKHFYNK